LVMLSVHLKISGHYPDGRSAWLKMGLPDGYKRAASVLPFVIL